MGSYYDKYPVETLRFRPGPRVIAALVLWIGAFVAAGAAVMLLLSGSTVGYGSAALTCGSVLSSPGTDGHGSETAIATCAEQRTRRLALSGISAAVAVGLGAGARRVRAKIV